MLFSILRLLKDINTKKFDVPFLLKMNQEIIKSFSIKETLNPKVWNNPDSPEKSTMKTKVFDGLSKVAETFIDYLGKDIIVDDIILTGSLSNFNWSEYSDFDLHIVIDFSQFGKQSELYKELFNLKKQIFNDKHNIKIFGYDVELYSQDSEEIHTSSGVYSIMNEDWLIIPMRQNPKIDKDILKCKIKNWTEKLDSIIDRSTKENIKGEKIQKIKDKIKEYRKSGLDKDSEFSYENLVFKYLRRSGYIEKLFNLQNKLIDKQLSIETMVQN